MISVLVIEFLAKYTLVGHSGISIEKVVVVPPTTELDLVTEKVTGLL